MHRRRFLASLGSVAGAGLLLPACGPLARGSDGTIPEGQPELVLRQPSPELVTGDARRYAFLLVDQDNRPIQTDGVDLYVADIEEEILGGPYEAVYHEEEGSALGTYRTHIDLPEPGQYLLIAVHEGEKGQGVVNVVDAADSAFPAPGDPAVGVPTPTTGDDHGYAELCTADPDCGMHGTSLEEALDAARPVLLVFATPAYCQTAVCGPAVQIADRVRTSGDWGDLAWVHCEIYTDAGQTVAPPVLEWNLPSEPWTYAIGADGIIAERIDGPLVADDLTDLAFLVT